MSSFPPELWMLITSYLPNDELKRLIGVNRYLTNLGLDARYRVAVAAPSFVYSHIQDYVESHLGFIHLSSSLPRILHRVHHLAFKDDEPITPAVLKTPLGNLAIMSAPNIANIKKGLFTSKQGVLQKYYTQLLEVCLDMHNLHAITFDFSKPYSSTDRGIQQHFIKHKMDVFKKYIHGRPSQITQLSISSKALGAVIQYWPDDISLPCLGRLRVNAEGDYGESMNVEQMQLISSFIHRLVNQLESSLEELELIGTANISEYLPLCKVIEGIKHLPRLQRLALYWYCHHTPDTHNVIPMFINEHLHQISELTIRITSSFYKWSPPSSDVADPALQAIFNPVLYPSLKHFNLYYTNIVPTDVAHSISDFLYRHSDQLLSLSILPVPPSPIQAKGFNVNGGSLSYRPVIEYLYGQSHRHRTHVQLPDIDPSPGRVPIVYLSFSRLERLSLFSSDLRFELMTFLTSSLPRLRYVSIRGLLSLVLPCNGMESASYKELREMMRYWELDDLELELVSYVQRDFRDMVRLAKFCVRVERICGYVPLMWLKSEDPDFKCEDWDWDGL